MPYSKNKPELSDHKAFGVSVHSWDTLACCWDIKQATNQQQTIGVSEPWPTVSSFAVNIVGCITIAWSKSELYASVWKWTEITWSYT